MRAYKPEPDILVYNELAFSYIFNCQHYIIKKALLVLNKFGINSVRKDYSSFLLA